MSNKKRLLGICGLALTGAAFLLCFRNLQNGGWLLGLLEQTLLKWEMPQTFGGFHLLWLGACFVFAILFGILGARRKTKHMDEITFLFGLVFLWLEGYKQLYSYFVMWEGRFDFAFFPFQFCSIPLYLCPLLPLIPDCRLKGMCYRFLAFFETMGGCLVMGYPAFYEHASLCIHTMLWHTLMISLGVYLLFANGWGQSIKRDVLPAVPVFLTSLGLATALNLLLTPLAKNSPNPLNLFYMSPYVPTTFLVVRDVQRAFGWLPSLLCYGLLFIFVGAGLVFLTVYLIRLVGKKLETRKKYEKQRKK